MAERIKVAGAPGGNDAASKKRSAIHFRSPSDRADLRGSERAYMGCMCNDMLAMSLGLNSRFGDAEWLRPFIPDGAYPSSAPKDRLPQTLATFLAVGDGALIIGGKEVDSFTLALNTACAIGGDVLELMARLHAQCEIHCFVEGPNRKWLAGIMRDSREEKSFAPAKGGRA